MMQCFHRGDGLHATLWIVAYRAVGAMTMAVARTILTFGPPKVSLCVVGRSSLTIIPTQKQFLCTVAEFLQLSILLKQASASAPIPCPTCTRARGAIQAVGRSVQANVVAFYALEGFEGWYPLTVHVRAASSHMSGCDAGVDKTPSPCFPA